MEAGAFPGQLDAFQTLPPPLQPMLYVLYLYLRNFPICLPQIDAVFISDVLPR